MFPLCKKTVNSIKMCKEWPNIMQELIIVHY